MLWYALLSDRGVTIEGWYGGFDDGFDGEIFYNMGSCNKLYCIYAFFARICPHLPIFAINFSEIILSDILSMAELALVARIG